MSAESQHWELSYLFHSLNVHKYLDCSNEVANVLIKHYRVYFVIMCFVALCTSVCSTTPNALLSYPCVMSRMGCSHWWELCYIRLTFTHDYDYICDWKCSNAPYLSLLLSWNLIVCAFFFLMGNNGSSWGITPLPAIICRQTLIATIVNEFCHYMDVPGGQSHWLSNL